MRLPCPGEVTHVLHTRCALDFLERAPAPAPLCCPRDGCGTRHDRRLVLGEIFHLDPDMSARVEGLGGEPAGDGPAGRRGSHYRWTQDSLNIGSTLDLCSIADLQRRFTTAIEIPSHLRAKFSRLFLHTLALLNFQLGQHRPPGADETPRSLVRAVKLFHVLPALLLSSDGRASRRDRFLAVERGDISVLLPWLLAFTDAAAARRRQVPESRSEAEVFSKAAANCKHRGGISSAARTLLAEARAPATAETFEHVRAKFGDEDPDTVAAAAAAAVAESRDALACGGDGGDAEEQPVEDLDPQILLDVIRGRSALSAAGNDGLRFSHLQRVVGTEVGKNEFPAAIHGLWRRIMEDSDAVPSEFWALFLQANLTALGPKCRPICVGSTMRRMLSAGAARQYRDRIARINVSEGQFGVGVAGGVERVALRAKVHHQTGCWVVGLDCSNAFNTVKRTAVFKEITRVAPRLAPLVAKCYGGPPADVFFELDSGERRTIASKTGVQQGDALGPALFCMPVGTAMRSTREAFGELGVDMFAYMDDIYFVFRDLNSAALGAVSHLGRLLEEMGVARNAAKTVGLPPMGHDPTAGEIALLRQVGVNVVSRAGMVVVGIPVGTDEFVEEHAMKIVKDDGVEGLARLLAHMPQKQEAMLVATKVLTAKTGFLERGVDTHLSRAPCERADNTNLWMLERLLELPDVEDEESFFAANCPADKLKLLPHQRVQAGLSTAAGGLGLASTARRRVSAALGSVCETLPEVIVSLTGSVGNYVRGNLPNAPLVRSLGRGLRDVLATTSVTAEALSAVLPAGLVAWANGPTGEDGELAAPTIDVLCGHDLPGTGKRRLQGKLGKLINGDALETFVASLDHLPAAGRRPAPDDPFGGVETSDLAKARHRSMSGPGALACLRAQPSDARLVIPADEFVRMERRFLGIEPYVAPTCPCCGTQDADTRHARICPRAGAQVNQHQPLIHALSRELRRHRIRHVVEDGSPFTRDRNLRMDITVVAGELRNASNGAYIHKGLLVDGTFADPQAALHLRQGSATVDGSTAATSEARKNAHYARPGHVSFDQRSYKLCTFAVECFGRLGGMAYEFVDQLATHVVGGQNGGEITRKGAVKERLLQVVSVTSQVAVSRRVRAFELATRSRQEARARQSASPAGVNRRPGEWGWSLGDF